MCTHMGYGLHEVLLYVIIMTKCIYTHVHVRIDWFLVAVYDCDHREIAWNWTPSCVYVQFSTIMFVLCIVYLLCLCWFMYEWLLTTHGIWLACDQGNTTDISYVLLVQYSFSGQWNSRTHTGTAFCDRCWVASNSIGPNKRIRCSDKSQCCKQRWYVCSTLSNFLWPYNVTISHTRCNCTHFLRTCTTTNWWVH